jgi:hypothetical protein
MLFGNIRLVNGTSREGDEQTDSQSHIPRQAKDDKALEAVLALIRGIESNPAFPPTPKQATSEP